MMPPFSDPKRRAPLGSRRSSMVVLFAICLVVMLALVGLGVDAGLCYIAKARMSKGADAASIVTTRYLGKPEAEMKRLAIQAYRRNDSVGTINADDITVTYERDAQGRPIKVKVRVRARYNQPLTFIRILGFRTVPLSIDAEAVRFPIAMGLVIDRSGSMTDNGGSTTIPATIPQFLSNFVPGFDTVGIYSYSWAPVREMAFTTNFLGTAMNDLFNGSANRIKFDGYTGPADCLRLLLEDFPTLDVFDEMGVKKIIVFMTDGIFNTFRTRPPNTMGAFNTPPTGKTQSWWNQNWFNTNRIYSSINQWGNNGNGLSPQSSTSGPCDDYPAVGGAFTCIRTNSAGNGAYFKNLDVSLNESQEMRIPVIGSTQYFVFGEPASSATYTNAYVVAGKTSSSSGYPQAIQITDTSIRQVHPRYRYSNVTVPGGSAITLFKSNNRFLSAVDGNWKTMSSANIQAEAKEHAKRYCQVARKTNTDPSRITVFTIGFGTGSAIDKTVLMQMANLNPSDSIAPYTRLNADQPWDSSFGFTQASDAAALQRTYIALGIYLATRLTK